MTEIPKKYKKSCLNLFMTLLIIASCIFIVPKILLLFMPFIIGWMIALLANPLVHFFEEKIKIKRKTGSALVIIAVIGGICLLLYAAANRLVKEAVYILGIMPQMWDDMKLEFVGFTEKWSMVIDSLPKEVVEKAVEVGDVIGKEMSVVVGELSVPTAGALGNFAQNIPGILISVIMCLLSAYFFVAEKNVVSAFLRKYFPESWMKKMMILKKTTIDVIAGYLKAQLKIEIWVYVIILIGFLILRVKYGYLLAALTAFVDILPVFGTGTILVPWMLYKLLMGEYMYALGLLLIWGISQLVRQVIQPKMIGDSMGMEPLPTLILLYLGYKLAGVLGMVIAVPLGILVMAMNEAGFFDNSKRSLKILWHGFHEFRQFTKEDLQGIEEAPKKDET